MIKILKCILLLLETYFEDRRKELQEMKLAAQKDRWLDAKTVKLMLRRGDRTLFTYVQNKKLTSKKIGIANFYLESSVLKLMNEL